MKTCCGYSLEVPQWGTSNEYPQHMFSWRNKKKINIFWSYDLELYGNLSYTFVFPLWPLWLFFVDSGRRGLRGLGSLLDDSGGELGLTLGDACFPPGLEFEATGYVAESGSLRIRCFKFSFSINWVSGSLIHRRNSSSTFSFKTGFKAISQSS